MQDSPRSDHTDRSSQCMPFDVAKPHTRWMGTRTERARTLCFQGSRRRLAEIRHCKFRSNRIFFALALLLARRRRRPRPATRMGLFRRCLQRTFRTISISDEVRRQRRATRKTHNHATATCSSHHTHHLFRPSLLSRTAGSPPPLAYRAHFSSPGSGFGSLFQRRRAIQTDNLATGHPLVQSAQSDKGTTVLDRLRSLVRLQTCVGPAARA